VTGLTVPPADAGALATALNRLLKDHELRFKFGEAARKRVEAGFDASKMAESTMNLYAELMSNGLLATAPMTGPSVVLPFSSLKLN
jgi:glycosyltransferase involved in cell wall biosynthesis